MIAWSARPRRDRLTDFTLGFSKMDAVSVFTFLPNGSEKFNLESSHPAFERLNLRGIKANSQSTPPLKQTTNESYLARFARHHSA